MISVYAMLSTLALLLPIIDTKEDILDENNISYDIAVHLGRTLSRRTSHTGNIDVNTKDLAVLN